MKVSSSSASKLSTPSKFSNHILPLLETKEDNEDEREHVRFKLRSDPLLATSPHYTFDLKILDTDCSLRQTIVYTIDAARVCKGLGIEGDGLPCKAIIERTMKGEVQNAFLGYVASEEARALEEARVARVNRLPRRAAVLF
jgi:hypothetical protein